MSAGFQCYAYAHGGVWHAICTDLDIAVDGVSRRVAEESLATAIGMHLEWVAELPREERSRFMARRAPWHVRFGLAVRTRIGRALGREQSRGFIVFQPDAPVPANGTTAAANPTGA